MKFKMKSIASILVAAAMMVTMAAPVFAIGESGDVINREWDEALYTSRTPQERITFFDGIYKVNDDGTFSSFREGKVTLENCDFYRVYQFPYVINLKVGETIRTQSAGDFSYFYNANLTDYVTIQEKSYEETADGGEEYGDGIKDYTGKAPGVYVGPTTPTPNFESIPGTIIWNITEDGSILTDEQITAYSEKGKAAGKGITFDIGSDTPRGSTPPPTSETTEETTTEAPVVTHYADGENYTVQAGDTLGLLSLNNYGSYNYADALYKANANVLKKSGGKIYKGLAIVIPETIATGVNKLATQTANEGEKLYTVKSEDTLGTIALAHYKDMSKYKEIFERNADRLKNANTIYAGQIIILP